MTLREELIEAAAEAIVAATNEDRPTALVESATALDAFLDVLEARHEDCLAALTEGES